VISITHSCIFTGIGVDGKKFNGGRPYDFASPDGTPGGLTTMGPGGKYQSIQIHLANEMPIKKIPGKGKRYITMRTSDVKTDTSGPLYDKISMTQITITQAQHEKCKELALIGGPYDVQWAYGPMKMYCIGATWTQEEGKIEPPDPWYNDKNEEIGPGFYSKWEFEFEEYNKGLPGGSTAPAPQPITTPQPIPTPQPKPIPPDIPMPPPIYDEPPWVNSPVTGKFKFETPIYSGVPGVIYNTVQGKLNEDGTISYRLEDTNGRSVAYITGGDWMTEYQLASALGTTPSTQIQLIAAIFHR
jgi:hypothetical protein